MFFFSTNELVTSLTTYGQECLVDLLISLIHQTKY